MQMCGCLAAAGQYEVFQLRQFLTDDINMVFDGLNLQGADTRVGRMGIFIGCCQISPDFEELWLQLAQYYCQFGVFANALCETHGGVEFIHGATSFDARAVLAYTPVAEQPR